MYIGSTGVKTKQQSGVFPSVLDKCCWDAYICSTLLNWSVSHFTGRVKHRVTFTGLHCERRQPVMMAIYDSID